MKRAANAPRPQHIVRSRQEEGWIVYFLHSTMSYSTAAGMTTQHPIEASHPTTLNILEHASNAITQTRIVHEQLHS
jgi:hypothetical protein